MSASIGSAPEIPPVAKAAPVRHRWTVSEFQRMGETGFLDPKARLELIGGELFERAPIGSFHAGMTHGVVAGLKKIKPIGKQYYRIKTSLNRISAPGNNTGVNIPSCTWNWVR